MGNLANKQPAVMVMGDLMMDYQYWITSMPEAGGDEAIIAAEQNSGGSAANTGVALSSQDVSCCFCGRIGDDDLGNILAKRMEAKGIDLSCLERCGDTGYTVTMIDRAGERTMFSYRGSSDHKPVITPALEGKLSQISVLCISGYMLLEPLQSEFVLKVAALARQKGAYVMLDTAPVIDRIGDDVIEKMLSHTDVLLPNRSELALITGETDVEAGIDKALGSVSCVVIKQGKGGARLAANAGFRMADGSVLKHRLDCTVQAKDVKPVDTTGAGDSFNAGFIAAFLKGMEPGQWLEAGNALAAKVIASKGAVSNFH